VKAWAWFSVLRCTIARVTRPVAHLPSVTSIRACQESLSAVTELLTVDPGTHVISAEKAWASPLRDIVESMTQSVALPTEDCHEVSSPAALKAGDEIQSVANRWFVYIGYVTDRFSERILETSRIGVASTELRSLRVASKVRFTLSVVSLSTSVVCKENRSVDVTVVKITKSDPKTAIRTEKCRARADF
jgi:hypothetical protein